MPPGSDVAGTEIFGPVLGLMHVETVEDAIDLSTAAAMATRLVFYRQRCGRSQFRYEAEAGNIGINIGVAAPMAYFPFSGWKDSFFGDLHGQGRDAVEFFTQKKVVVERWPKEWSRTF